MLMRRCFDWWGDCKFSPFSLPAPETSITIFLLCLSDKDVLLVFGQEGRTLIFLNHRSIQQSNCDLLLLKQHVHICKLRSYWILCKIILKSNCKLSRAVFPCRPVKRLFETRLLTSSIQLSSVPSGARAASRFPISSLTSLRLNPAFLPRESSKLCRTEKKRDSAESVWFQKVKMREQCEINSSSVR